MRGDNFHKFYFNLNYLTPNIYLMNCISGRGGEVMTLTNHNVYKTSKLYHSKRLQPEKPLHKIYQQMQEHQVQGFSKNTLE